MRRGLSWNQRSHQRIQRARERDAAEQRARALPEFQERKTWCVNGSNWHALVGGAHGMGPTEQSALTDAEQHFLNIVVYW